MYLYTSRILFQKHSIYKCQFWNKVRATSRLVSQNWAKDKDVSGSTQSSETSCKNKLKLTELKDFCLESKEKSAKER